MATKTRVVIYLDVATVAALRALRAKGGASLSELCRRAIAAGLATIHSGDKNEPGKTSPGTGKH